MELLPLFLVALNLAFWGILVAAKDPLPVSYFDERDGRVRRTPHGVELDLTSDVDPLLILAERPIVRPVGGDPLARLVALANLPAVLANTTTIFIESPATGGVGSRAASWIGTAAFLLVSTAQWCLLGFAAVWFARWRRTLRERARPL